MCNVAAAPGHGLGAAREREDYAYGISGSLKPGLATITFRNEGKEPHVMALEHLKSGKTAKDFLKAVKSGKQAAIGKLGVNGDDAVGAPFVLAPGQETQVVTDNLKPGIYGMLCYFPDATGTPHFAKGMVATFTVKGAKFTKAPSAQAEVELTDTGINVPPSDAPTSVTLKITNSGSTPHSFAVVKLNGSATIDAVNDYFNNAYQGGPWPADAPGDVVGSLGDLKPAATAYLTWKDLPAGRDGDVSTSGDDPPNDDDSKGLHGEFNIS